MDLYSDQRIVMTLDAGGTNFVYSALQGGREIVEPVIIPSKVEELDLCLKSILKGFEKVRSKLENEPVAISFAFPGPADYPAGIIGDPPNLPAFRGGVALGPMLEEMFDLPVFINNDGDLFTYGEAMAGLLPEVNSRLKEKGIQKEYKNLLGVTIGTGFGAGTVIDGRLCIGDNSASSEIWLMRNFRDIHTVAEEGVSIRAIKNFYLEHASEPNEDLVPRDIYEIALGEKDGDRVAALSAFEAMAEVLGESLANAITLIDGIIVIGGGISGAHRLFLPKVVEHLNGTIEMKHSGKISRLVSRVYNLEEAGDYEQFLTEKREEIPVPFTNKKISYYPEKRLAVGISRLETSRAVSLGAYAYALDRL